MKSIKTLTGLALAALLVLSPCLGFAQAVTNQAVPEKQDAPKVKPQSKHKKNTKTKTAKTPKKHKKTKSGKEKNK